jgi:hypothetical protein
METFVHRMSRNCYRRHMVMWAALSALGLFLVVGNLRYIENFVNGPFPMSGADLQQITDTGISSKYYVRVTGSQVIETGLQEITTKKKHGREVSRQVSANYVALQVGDRFLLVKTASTPSLTVEGELAPMPAGLRQNLFGSPETEALEAQFHPFYLDTASFRFEGYVALGAGVVFLGLLVFYGGRAWKRLQRVETVPVVRRVASWGDPVAISAEIAREYVDPVFRDFSTRITDHYVVVNQLLYFDVFRLQDLLWVYKRVTKKSFNFIPVGKSYEAVLNWRYHDATVKGNERDVENMLQEVSRRVPWAMVGYSEELEQHYTRTPDAFRQAVETRKQDLAKHNSPV